MERIEALITKLKQQYDQQADPNVILGTVQLLQFELSKAAAGKQQTLGTAKVAVTLPGNVPAGIVAADHERYAPKPVEKPLAAASAGQPERILAAPVPPSEEQLFKKEERGTLLVDDESLSVVQKNGQLDMVLDPMKDIPTLSQQSAEKNINNTGELPESLNDKLKQGKTEIIEVLKETPVKDLRKAIGINDRFLFINELFRGDENMYERSIKTINAFNIFPEAEYWISRELKLKLGWNADSIVVAQFDQLVRRRFS